MSDMLDVLIVGATGQQGGAVADWALTRGHRVRVLVRDPRAPGAQALQKRGAEPVAGDLDAQESLERACRGVDGVFVVLTCPEGAEVELRRGRSMFSAARRAGVKHVVYSSAASADAGVDVPHIASKRPVELALQDEAMGWTIVAPVYYMENALSPWAIEQLRQGRVARFLPPAKPLQQVALADIGKAVVHILESGERLRRRRIELASDSISTRDQARILGQHLGRQLAASQASTDLLPSASPFARSVLAMLDWLGREGFTVDIEALHRELSDVEWSSFSTWVKRQDWHTLLQE